MPANTGKAGAINRVGFFAGEPAPTGPAQCLRLAPYLWEPGLPAMGRKAAPDCLPHSHNLLCEMNPVLFKALFSRLKVAIQL